MNKFTFKFNEIKPAEENEYWAYYPNLFSAVTFEEILAEFQPHCKTYTNKIYGKVYEAKRISCVVGANVYGGLNNIKWKTVPFANQIKAILDNEIMPHFYQPDAVGTTKPGMVTTKNRDIYYLLSHIYRKGTDYIGFHNDREALDTPVISVTFAPQGIKRKFRFRKMGEKSGWEKQFELGHGDLLIMKAGCQRKYKHSVPVEKTVIEPRINFTYRYKDKNGKQNPTNTKLVKSPSESVGQLAPKIKIGLKGKIPIMKKLGDLEPMQSNDSVKPAAI